MVKGIDLWAGRAFFFLLIRVPFMALGSASVVAPVMIGSKSSEWQGYAKRVFLVSVAAVAIICIGVIVAERKTSNQSDALGGAYYAVTKPPAFNFNRKILRN